MKEDGFNPAEDQNAREIQIAMIKSRLSRQMDPDIRAKFEAKLAELQGEKPPVRPAAPPLPLPPLKPAAPEPKKVAEAPKRKVAIWTPEGEKEIEIGTNPSSAPTETKPHARTPENRMQQEKPTGIVRVPEQPGQSEPAGNVPAESAYFGSDPQQTAPAAGTINSPLAPVANDNQEIEAKNPPTASDSWSRGAWNLTGKYALLAACIIGLLLAASDSSWSEGAYQLLHLVVCAVSLYWAVYSFRQKQTAWVWALATNAFMFSPAFPKRIRTADWEPIYVCSAAFLAAWTTFLAVKDWRTRRKPD